MQCKTCGTQFPDNMNQCPNCGTPISNDVQQMNQGSQYNNPMNQGNQFNNQMNQGNQFNNQMNQGNQFNNQMNQGSQYNNPMNQGSQYNNPMNQGNQFNNQMNQGSQFNNQMNQGNQFNNQMNQGNQFNNPMNQGNQFNNNSFNSSNNLNQPYYNSAMGQQGSFMNNSKEMMKEQKKQFFKSQECDTARHLITAAAVMLYISATVTFIVAIYTNSLQLIDATLLVAFGVLLQVLKSRIAAVICGAYSLFNVCYLMITAHTFGGWLILIAAICAIIGTFSMHSNWDKYCKASGMPQAQ